MSPATPLPPPPDARMGSQRSGHDAGWLDDHDPDSHHRRGYPDPVGDAAAANVDRQRRGR